MRHTSLFTINGEDKVLELFKVGDRVQLVDGLAIGAKGTVVKAAGLFAEVKWDESSYPSKDGSSIMLGRQRMIDGLELISEVN